MLFRSDKKNQQTKDNGGKKEVETSPIQKTPPKPSNEWLMPAKEVGLKPLKADAGLIHGVDQYRGGQTILTAKLKLPSGEEIKVAVPNEGGGWRPEQRDFAEALGYKTLDASKPGSRMHAEKELEVFRQKQKAVVLEWSISRGKGGTSTVCNEGCKYFTRNWGPQQQ